MGVPPPPRGSALVCCQTGNEKRKKVHNSPFVVLLLDTVERKYRLQRGIYQLKLKSAALCSMEKLKLYCSYRGTELARSAFDRRDEMNCLFLETFPSRAKNCSGSYLLFHFSVQETRDTISSSQCRHFLEGS